MNAATHAEVRGQIVKLEGEGNQAGFALAATKLDRFARQDYHVLYLLRDGRRIAEVLANRHGDLRSINLEPRA